MGWRRLSHTGSLSRMLTTKVPMLLTSRCVCTLFSGDHIFRARKPRYQSGPHTIRKLFHQTEVPVSSQLGYSWPPPQFRSPAFQPSQRAKSLIPGRDPCQRTGSFIPGDSFPDQRECYYKPMPLAIWIMKMRNSLHEIRSLKNIVYWNILFLSMLYLQNGNLPLTKTKEACLNLHQRTLLSSSRGV